MIAWWGWIMLCSCQLTTLQFRGEIIVETASQPKSREVSLNALRSGFTIRKMMEKRQWSSRPQPAHARVNTTETWLYCNTIITTCDNLRLWRECCAAAANKRRTIVNVVHGTGRYAPETLNDSRSRRCARDSANGWTAAAISSSSRYR